MSHADKPRMRTSWQRGPVKGVHRWDHERLDTGDQELREMLAVQRVNARKHSTPALPPTAEKVADPKSLLILIGVALGFPMGAASLFMFQLAQAV